MNEELEAIKRRNDRACGSLQQREDIAWLLGEIEELQKRCAELEKAAEDEFQRAEGKAEMKRYFQEEIAKLTAQLKVSEAEVKTLLVMINQDSSAFRVHQARLEVIDTAKKVLASIREKGLDATYDIQLEEDLAALAREEANG